MLFNAWISWITGRGRWPVLAVLLLISVVLAQGLMQLTVEGDPRSMTSQDPEQQRLQQQLIETFGNDETLFLSITPANLQSLSGISLVRELSDRVGQLTGVTRVLSLTTARQLISGRYGAEDRSLLPDSRTVTDWSALFSSALEQNPHYQHVLVSKDGRSAGLLIQPVISNDDKNLPDLISQLRHLISEYSSQAQFHLTGVAVQKHDVAAFIQRDQRVVLPLVGVVLSVMLTLIFRHVTGVLLPLLTTGISLVWTLGLYGLAGLAMNTISSLLPPVVMILCISNAVHLYNGWLMLPGEHDNYLVAWRQRIRELSVPCFFTAITTALGLMSLTISSVPAVRQFGLFGAIGVLSSLIISLTFLPVILTFFQVPEKSYRRGKGGLGKVLDGATILTLQYPRMLIAGTLLSLLLAVIALPQVQNNTRLTGFFRASSVLAMDSTFIDQNFGGINALEFIVQKRDGTKFDQLNDFRRLSTFVSTAIKQDVVKNVFSSLPLLRQLQRAEMTADKLVLPDTQDDLEYLLSLLEQPQVAEVARQFLSDDHKVVRLTLLLSDIGSRQALTVVDDLQRSGRSIFGAAYELQPTGSYYQVVKDSGQLVAAMLKSFGLSLVMVMVALMVLLRNLRLTLLALIPNIIPIIWALGVMGWWGIDLSTGTAMIGAVAFGLAVDDTIHYLVSFTRLKGKSTGQRIQLTTSRVGRALVVSTVVLALGFWTGCFGSFKPTIYFSFLVGGTLCGALICDLLVLPASLLLWNPVSAKGCKR